MSRRVSLPKIDVRKAEHLLRQLRRMAPHYTREWPAKDDDDPGIALLTIFSSIAEGVISRLNRAPDRNFLAFLDMLGIRLLPKTPARVPVTFKLANGTEVPFLVPKETQVSAAPNADRPEELPFETIEPLWAIPAKLTELFVVDPVEDHIYKPHAKFLTLEKVENELPPLRITAFSAKDSKFLQLDPPDQVKKDDFLRIDNDHLVVLDAQGSIVTVTDPLPRDYVEGTEVKRVTDFELFEARNWQEHVLYLGHADYFAIKSEAQIELKLEHAGPTANLEPLSVVWEFFGVTETQKEEEWRPFEVELDGTEGFSRNGNVVLNKPAGEIKEKEIDGRKNRWIRARLDGPLPATPARLLPTVESVFLKVSSAAEGLAPDQAFHNETPLTTDVEFFPFGTEPRTFDRFAIASEEAFSKHGAEISLDFEFDTADLLASPAAGFVKTQLQVYAVAAGGKLIQFDINPLLTSAAITTKYKPPKDTRLSAGSTPAVVSDETTFGVFAKADDNRIHMLSPGPTDEPPWTAVTATPGTLQFNPAAALFNSRWRVYVVADNKLYSRSIDPANPAPDLKPTWDPIADNPKIDSSPFPLQIGRSLAVFVTDFEGKTHMNRGSWILLTPTSSGKSVPTYVAAKNARPFARTYTDDDSGIEQARVFVRNTEDVLVVMDTVPGRQRSLGAPDGGVGSNPFGSAFPGEKHIFVRAKGSNDLWSTIDEANNVWTNHGTSNEINLDGDPFIIQYPKLTGEFVSTLSTSRKNALLEFRESRETLGSGSIEVGPKSLVVPQEFTGDPSDYIHVVTGPGSKSPAGTVREIDKDLSDGRLLVLKDPLSESPTTETRYNLLNEVLNGEVVAADDTSVELEEGDGDEVRDGDYLFIDGQIRRIPRKPAHGVDTVSTDPDNPWDPIPADGRKYQLLRIDDDLNDQAAAASSATRLILKEVRVPHDHVNRFLRIDSGPGENHAGRRIISFSSGSKRVVLANDLPGIPDNTSTYVITTSSIPEAWFVHNDPDQKDLRPDLSWEYWNGRGWLALRVKDTTDNLLVEGSITFVIPDDIEKTEVAGQENYWIRARIVAGDYGREQFKFNQKTGEVTSEKDPIRPPKVMKSTKGSGSGLTIKYKLTELKQPEFCLTFNNLSYLDQTAANNTADKHFKPYLPLEDTGKAVYFGFDREFSGGPVRLYIEAKELEVDDRDQLELTWEFASENTFKSMSADDKTKAFTRPEFVSWVVPLGLQNSQEFGKALYWLRATLTRGDWKQSPLFKGVFLNTVAALQARTVRNEILGSSAGTKNQKFRFQQVPVLKGEEVRVLEVLTDNQREQLVKEQGDDVVRAITDQRGEVLQTWIRWTEVIEFFDSKSDSRHYRLDRHTGEIEFGDGVRGRIPPPGGDSIQAFAYQTGGGVAGNVQAGEITAAVTAVSGVDSVINPVGAGGGSEAATNEEMLEIGPAQISHRDRAVTPEDFERLAREASREVRKALCLPNRNASGRQELGWTSVFIVPASKAATPTPTLALRRSVQGFLAERADVTLVHQDRIFVGPPKYVPVSVEVTVVAKSFDVVASAEQSVRQKLDAFLHPLTGGPANEGWDFGRDLAASDLYALLEDIDDVDHIATLRMVFGDSSSEDKVDVDDDALVASGTHKISMDVVTENR